MMFRLPPVYPITDQQQSGLSHTEQVQLLAKAGARLIQLRDKHSSPREFHREAARALAAARQLQVRIIINDRVDIAAALKADGVHLGQDDMPPAVARRILGETALIGFSTHNFQQATDAARLSIDYLAFGPIFTTSSKADSEAVVGLDQLSQVRQLIKEKPLVAIGGITLANACEVFRAGADSIALISALLDKPEEINMRLQKLLALSGNPL
jgi:thiamine-phosphate pyrophosphorylase